MYTVSILSENFDVKKQLELQNEVIKTCEKNFIMEKTEEDFLKYRGKYGFTFGAFCDRELIGQRILYKKELNEKLENEDLRGYLWQ
ncbi:MAG TPA: hypothetical protein VLL98_00450 [Rickettsiales bacterium]|nr:hypothetical protein [Rickettsiales bacterium]